MRASPTSVRLQPEMLQRAKAVAERLEITISNLVTVAVGEYVAAMESTIYDHRVWVGGNVTYFLHEEDAEVAAAGASRVGLPTQRERLNGEWTKV